MSLDIDAAKDAKDDAQSGNLRANDAGIPDEHGVDYENATVLDDVKLHPESLIVFDHIARISIQDYGADGNILQMEQNLDGAGPNSYGFDIELTLANPEIIDGELWTETDAEWPSHKIVGDPTADTNPYEVRENVIRDDDGNVTDAETEGLGDLPGGNSWDGERDELDEDYLTVTINGSRGTDVLGALDTAGRWFTDKEGTVIEGLFETPPGFGTDAYDAENDPAPRLTGYPELRSDMVGQRGAILCSFDTDDATEAGTRTAIELSLFSVTDDDTFDALLPLTPEDDAYAKPTYPRVNNTVWEDGVDASGQTSGGVASAQAMMDDADDDSDVTYDDLNPKGQAFVDDAVEAIETMDLAGVGDFEDPDFAGRVDRAAQRDNFYNDADAIQAIVERKL